MISYVIPKSIDGFAPVAPAPPVKTALATESKSSSPGSSGKTESAIPVPAAPTATPSVPVAPPPFVANGAASSPKAEWGGGREYFSTIVEKCDGQWHEILPALTPLHAGVLIKQDKDHPCKVCGGESTIWPAEDAERTGRIACRTCTKNKPTGDGIATVAAFRPTSQGEAARLIAELRGISIGNSFAKKPAEKVNGTNVVRLVCEAKRMPEDHFRKFGVKPANRGRGEKREVVARVNVYNEKGEVHSYFDISPDPQSEIHKGKCKPGKGNSGLFLPGKLPKPSEDWLISEGCKDAAKLQSLGYLACGLPRSSMGDKYAPLFKDCNVILIPDLDEAGQAGAIKSARVLKGIAASVLIANLPGKVLPKGGPDCRDIAEWFGEEAIHKAIREAAEPPEDKDGEVKPEIELDVRRLGEVVETVAICLGNIGQKTPWISPGKAKFKEVFQRGGKLVDALDITEIQATNSVDATAKSAGSLCVRRLDEPQIRLRISDACTVGMSKKIDDGEYEFIPSVPPAWLTKGLLTFGAFGKNVRVLNGVTNTPTIRPDGTILQEEGYDAATGLLYRPSAAFPCIPENPTLDDAKRAAAELLDVIKDFQFYAGSDKSAWIAWVLTTIARIAVDGCCPFMLVSARGPGSGKGLAADAAMLIATGCTAPKTVLPLKDDDVRKLIIAAAIEAAPTINFDNVEATICSPSLDAAITSLTVRDRVLGKSESTGIIPLLTVFSATANNPKPGSDLARRTLPIRLAAQVERPEDRTGFEHPDLLAWVRLNRPRLAVAALTIVRAYFAAGRPEQPGGVWGSFESWSALIRGSIVWAGLPDPLKTRETVRAEDTSSSTLRGLIFGMREIDPDSRGKTVRDIVSTLNGSSSEWYSTLREVLGEIATDKRGYLCAKLLGYAFRKYRDRLVNIGPDDKPDVWRITGDVNRRGVFEWFAAKPDAAKSDAGDAALPSASPAPSPAPSHAPVSPENTRENTDAGDAGDNLKFNICENTTAITTAFTTERTHTRKGETLKTSPASPASPAADGPPCEQCGAATIPNRTFDGYLNLDCPACEHVKAIPADPSAKKTSSVPGRLLTVTNSKTS